MFGQFLIQNNVISNEQLQKSLELQKETNLPIGETLVEMGAIDKETLNKYLQIHLLQQTDIILDDPEIKTYI